MACGNHVIKNRLYTFSGTRPNYDVTELNIGIKRHVLQATKIRVKPILYNGHPKKENELEEDPKGDGETASRKLVAANG